MLFFPKGKGVMNAPQFRELRDDACSPVETSANTPRFSYPYIAMNFHGRVGNWDPHCQQLYEVALN
jgi:hypothetical protein